MSLAPGSVWVDAQGAQSAGYAERGIGRFIGEQISAVNKLSPGWSARSTSIPTTRFPRRWMS